MCDACKNRLAEALRDLPDEVKEAIEDQTSALEADIDELHAQIAERDMEIRKLVRDVERARTR